MPSRVLLALSSLAVVTAGLAATSAGTASAAPPSYTVRPGVTQLEVLKGTPGDALELVGSGGTVAGTGTIDARGSLVWRQLDPGTYTVREAADHATASAPADVAAFSDPAPAPGFYKSQHLDNGFGYVTTRDGTTLSVNVTLPGPASDGPYPTVVEYSGYDPSNPASTTFAQLYNALGYAYVGVNIRGTGCSGGSYLPFEPVQSLDGYDAIEAIAAQSWVKFHKVGMVGISYPGISQLYVAQTEPPSLDAITPLSVIDDTYRGTLYPGGILNTGFAVSWANARAHDAAPYGEGWEQGRVDGGDTECASNQDVRLQNPDPLALIEDNPFYNDTYYDPINPSGFASKINVPVFTAGAWQDEQTGGHMADFLDRFTSSPHLYANLTNGSHTESLSLGVFGRMADFLDVYVARKVPGDGKQGGAKDFVAPLLAQQITGVSGLKLPTQIDYTGLDARQARARFEKTQGVRVLFEEGAAAGQPSGAPLPRFEKHFAAWPIPGATAQKWFLGAHGVLRRTPVHTGIHKSPARRWHADPTALPATDYTGPGNDIWKAKVNYDWRQNPQGTGLAWISPKLARTQVLIGTGSVNLWVRSAAKDVDLEATLSEVRPNGKEVYVQSGWLRASHRKLDPAASTPVKPVHTDLAADARPLPRGKFSKVRLELFPFAHPFRKNSQLRLTIDAPGNARPLWAFQTLDHGQRVAIAADHHHRSNVVLSLVGGIEVPAKAPACGSLRSQPCRTYRP